MRSSRVEIPTCCAEHHREALDAIATVVANHAAEITRLLHGRDRGDEVDPVLGLLANDLVAAVRFGRQWAEASLP